MADEQALKAGLMQQLKDQLRSIRSEEPDTRGIRLIRIEIPVDDLELLEWLHNQESFPKLYWSGRDDGLEYAGAGSALLPLNGQSGKKGKNLMEMENICSSLPGARVFGAMFFHPVPNNGRIASDPEWEHFQPFSCVLPKYELSRTAAGTVLASHHRVNLELPDTRIIEAVESELSSLTFGSEAIPASLSAECPDPGSPEKQHWQEMIESVKELIRKEEIRKVVLSRKRDLIFQETISPLSIISQFKQMKSPAYFYCFQPAPDSAFIGSSPERLYRRNRSTISSEALAGTRKRGDTPEEDSALEQDLLSNPKDFLEHDLVYKHVKEVFDDLCMKTNDLNKTKVMKLIKVQHLWRKLSGILKSGISDSRILESMHPTPAVAGTPVARAREIIEKEESFDRGLYCGPIGWMKNDSADFAVGIRCGLIKDKVLTLYGGAGITGDSQAEKEWEEIENKFSNFVDVLGI